MVHWDKMIVKSHVLWYKRKKRPINYFASQAPDLVTLLSPPKKLEEEFCIEYVDFNNLLPETYYLF